MNLPVGAFIGLRDKKELLLAVVLEVSEARLRYLTERGREDRIQTDKVLVALGRSSSTHDRDALAVQLAAARERIEAIRTGIDLDALWQLLGGAGDAWSAQDLSREYFGAQATGEHEAAMVSTLLADSIYFKQKGDQYARRPETQVEEILVQRRAEEQRVKERLNAAQWLRGLSERDAPMSDGAGAPPPQGAARYLDLLKSYTLNPESFDAQAEMALFARDLGLGSLDRWLAFELLVKAGVWSADENLLLHQHRVRDHFAQEAMAHHDTLVAAGIVRRERAQDLTELDAFTVDDASTQDIDDALSIEPLADGLSVGVHIADVSAFIEPRAPLDVEAGQRGQTIYLPERKIQMLPDRLTTRTLSLVAGEEHPAFTLVARFDRDLTMTGFRLCFSRISVRRRLTYEDVDARLASGDSEPLARLLALATHLRQKRQAAGALIFSVPELRVWVDPDGTVSVQRQPADTPAHLVVSEMMVLANSLVASWLHEHSIPAIYRCQAAPEEPVSVSGYDPVLFYRMRKLLKKPESSLSPRPHSGLGVPAYVQITSPIRRYVDLVLHRQLAAALDGQPPPYTAEDLAGIADAADRAADVAGQVQRGAHRYWMLKYLRGCIGLTTPAIVLEKRDESWVVQLADYLIEVPLYTRPESHREVGEHLSVRITQVDPRRGFVRIEEA